MNFTISKNQNYKITRAKYVFNWGYTSTSLNSRKGRYITNKE